MIQLWDLGGLGVVLAGAESSGWQKTHESLSFYTTHVRGKGPPGHPSVRAEIRKLSLHIPPNFSTSRVMKAGSVSCQETELSPPSK